MTLHRARWAPDPGIRLPSSGANTYLSSDVLSLRRARSSDAESIAHIANSVDFHDYSRYGRGFVVYTLSPSDYARRILCGHLGYMFVINNFAIGYVCGCDHALFARGLQEDNMLTHQSNVCRAIRALAESRGDSQYHFLEQIAILPERQDRGFGEAFFRKFCEIHAGPFYVSMLEAPLRNPRIAYWEARGFKRIGVATEALPTRLIASLETHGLKWGIYVLPKNGFRAIRRCDRRVIGPVGL